MSATRYPTPTSGRSTAGRPATPTLAARKPTYATTRQWCDLGYRPVRGATWIIEHGRRLVAAWNVEPIGTGRRAPQ